MPSIFDHLFAAAGMPLFSHYSGSPAVYLPADGGRRSIVGICSRETGPDQVDETGGRQFERIWIVVWRDPRTGIDAPREGDALLLEDDREDSPWSFQGEIRNQSAGAWELLFARIRPVRYGPR